MFGMGALEMMIILVIVLVLFGGSKLPNLVKSLGKSMREFKKGVASESEEEQAPKPQPAASAGPAPVSARLCGSCKGALEAAWTHCPSCGAPAAKAPTPGG
ncbi:MAG: twin-arginine translocase TatA/TatE family subunit [Candidatus Rokubacteria bacterium]|nr:twin-arginine translocase TatA/TatE family subunit [Candidatus Rokubacteria bacterium]